LQGLKAARDRGVAVEVVYHYRHKGGGNGPSAASSADDSDDDDDTWKENLKAAEAAGLSDICVQRKANPQGAIMHDKYVILLQQDGQGELQPQAVWTGSTNWTDGGIYGQLNVGHGVYDASVAKVYETHFQMLRKDPVASMLKAALGQLTPVPE